jgi:hypothetical protein
MKRVSKFLMGLLLIGSFTLNGVPTARASGVTLADLLAGGSITFGDKIFYNFHNATTHGTLNVAYNQIFVDGVVGGQNNDELGIRFSSSAWLLTGANQSYDLGFDFSATRTDGLPLIHDVTLEMTGNVTGNGSTDIAEGVTNGADSSTLANLFTFISSSSQNLIDHEVFPQDVAVANISKDFAMSTGEDSNARVFVSHFDQTFSQTIPEPTSVVMLGIGVGLVVFPRLRRRMGRA